MQRKSVQKRKMRSNVAQRSYLSMKRTIIYLLLAGMLVSCAGGEKKCSVAPIVVGVMQVTAEQVSGESRYVGTICAKREVPVSVQTAGRILSIDAEDGSFVRAGDPIACIDSTQAVNRLNSAQALLTQAQDGYDRMMKVYAKGGVTDQQRVEIESQLTQAQSLYASAKERLDECRVIAPVSGWLRGMDKQEGQSVMIGSQIGVIADMSAFTVRFTVPEAEVGAVAIGQKGILYCAAVEKNMPIVVTKKNISANPLAHTYEISANVKGETKGLMPGMVAKVTLLSTDSAAHMVLPTRCIHLMPEGHTVWVVNDGKAERRSIEIDGYQADGVRVRSGLQIGERVVIDGYQKLYKGCAVVEQE